MEDERAQLTQAIAALESQRDTLGDAVVDAALVSMRARLAALDQEQETSLLPATLRGERRPVTIMFADLSGFTRMAENLDPETVRNLVNGCFERLVPVVEKYGGSVDKFIGDEVMALFGAPQAHENDPERALRAALEMMTALDDFNSEQGTAFRLHFGINTGLVIAGEIGTQQYRQYSVMGDAVNVAARLADLSEPGQVLVGETTYHLTAHIFDFTPLPPVSLKGKRTPQRVYLLEGKRAYPGERRGLRSLGLSAPLVGRADELHILREAIAEVQAGRGGLVAVIGEAGVGKSRLVAELRQHATVTWYEGRCLSYGQNLSYHPFISLLRDMASIPQESSPTTDEPRLREFLETLLPGQVDETYPYLVDLMGLPLTPSMREQVENLAGESRQWQIFHIFEKLLEQVSCRAPTVVVLEDLHWADPTSLALVEHLAPLTKRTPLLLVLVMRPFCGSACRRLLDNLRSGTDGYTEIALTPLSPTHSRELIAHLLIVESLPDEVRELILNRAEGNPLFLEEIIRSLIGQGILRQEKGQWHISPGFDSKTLSIPLTLQEVILARLDQLEEKTKSVLQMAAVIGRIFWHRVLAHLLPDEPLLDYHLDRLEQVALIRQTRRQPDREYIFKHVLIQEATYRSLLREQRRLFHRRVAEALETLFADRLEEHYGLLAHHYEVAGVTEQALRYLRLAGERARHTYALAEAETYYRRALALLPPDEDEVRQHLLLELGLVAMTRGDFAQAGERYAEAFRLRESKPEVIRRTYVRRPLRVYWLSPPRSLEPGVPSDIASGLVVQQLFAGLVTFDSELNIVPQMASRWEVDSTGRLYRFHLRPDARWSDGQPVTAHDFVYAWRRWLRPETGAELAALLYVIRGASDYHQGRNDDPDTIGVRAINERTLEIELREPVAYFFPLLASMPFSPLPSHRWPPERDVRDDPAALVVNGPFRLAEWREDRLIFERNPAYCGISQGNVARVEAIFPTTPDDRLKRFLADEIDVCRIPTGLQDEFVRHVPPERWTQGPSFHTRYCGLMPTAPPLDDRRVRQALTLAVDRTRLAVVGSPLSIPARGGFVPPGMPGHTPSLSAPYAPERALKLLREAGYAGWDALPPLLCAVTSPSPRVQALISAWEALGMRITVERWDMKTLMSRAYNDPPHLFTVGWVADYPDPHTFLAQGFLQGLVWREPSFWEMARAAARTLDVRRRMSLYHDLDRRLVVDEALCIPLTYGRTALAIQPRVLYYPLHPIAYTPLRDVVLRED